MPPPLPLPPPSPPVSPPPPPPAAYTTPSTTTGPSYAGISFELSSNPVSPSATSGVFYFNNPTAVTPTAVFRVIDVAGRLTLPTPPPPGNLWQAFLFAFWSYTGSCDYPDLTGNDVTRSETFPYGVNLTQTYSAAIVDPLHMFALPRDANGLPSVAHGFRLGGYAVKVRLVVYNVRLATVLTPPLPAHDQWYDGGTVTFT